MSASSLRCAARSRKRGAYAQAGLGGIAAGGSVRRGCRDFRDDRVRRDARWRCPPPPRPCFAEASPSSTVLATAATAERWRCSSPKPSFHEAHYEEAAQWCAEVHGTLNEDDLTDAIGAIRWRAFSRPSPDRTPRPNVCPTRAIRQPQLSTFTIRPSAYYWHARSLALNGQLAEARAAVAVAVSIYESKGDRPASTSARALHESLSR